MLLMVEKGIRRGICHSVYWYEKTNKKYMKDYNKNKNHLIFNAGMQIIYMNEKCHKSFQ